MHVVCSDNKCSTSWNLWSSIFHFLSSFVISELTVLKSESDAR